VEIRLSRVDQPGSWGPLRLGGWPLSDDVEPQVATGIDEEGPHATVRGTSARSRLRGLRGFAGVGVREDRGTSPPGPVTSTPWLATAGPAPIGEVLVAAGSLHRDTPCPPDPAVAVEPTSDGAHQVRLTWSTV